MAGAEQAVQYIDILPLEVPKKLSDGSKFIKWSEDTGSALPVTLRVHPQGYLLYWQEPNKEVECLELSAIRDTRTGKYAKVPRDPGIKRLVESAETPIEKKCLTIVHGVKFPEPVFVNFIAVGENPQNTVEEWADFILKLAYHPLTKHISVQTSIEKMYARVTLETDKAGQIQVKRLIKMFGGHTKRVEEVLKGQGLISDKGKPTIDPEDFPLMAFKKLMQLTCQRPELDEVFAGFGTRRMAFHCLSQEQLKDFLNSTQRDPRLNEILYPFHTNDQVENIICSYEPNIMLAKRAQLSLEGLDAYLQSDENLPISIQKFCLNQEMNAPLPHYFINSSHNTYLTGSQYKSKSDPEMYRQVLLAGCRCVELDCWLTSTNECIVNHGFTLCSPCNFKDVIEAINESAFKTSKYPVLLSFENHVDNPQQQAKMAEICRDIFGDQLLIDPLSDYPLEPNQALPSPQELLNKIIVKNKKAKSLADEANAKNSNSDEKGHKHKRGSLSPEVNGTTGGLLAAAGAAKMLNNRKQSSGSPVSTSNQKQRRKKSEPILHTMLSAAENTTKLNDAKTPVHKRGHSEVPARHSSPDILSIHTMRPGALAANKRNGDITTLSEDPEKEEKETENVNCQSTKENNNEVKKPEVTSIKCEEGATKNKEDIEEKSKLTNSNGDEVVLNGGTENTSVETGEAESDNKEVEEGEIGEDGERKQSVKKEDDEDSEDEGELSKAEYEQNMNDGGTAMRESRAYEAMSSLVNYVQPVRFKSFEIAEKRSRHYEMSSFTETNALKSLLDAPQEMVKYNKRQMSRIYPKGARIDSTNYNPQVFWCAGCQLAALNFQCLDHAMQLNLSMFELNGNCGYILKPPQLRMKDKLFDPMTDAEYDGVIAGYVSIKVISGQFLATSKVSTYVSVDMYGLYVDTVRKKFKTKTVMNNGLNPYYNEKPFEFKMVVMPSLAMLRIAVFDNTNNRVIGYRYIPVEGLRSGYRYITLRNEGNQPLTMSSLFVHIQVRDYIREDLKDFVNALTNPIGHIEEKDKEERERKEKEKALRILLDGDECEKMGLEPVNGDGQKQENGEIDTIKIIENPDDAGTRSPGDPTRVIVGLSERQEQVTKEKKVPAQLEPFEPDPLDVIRKKRMTKDLKESEKQIKKFEKKQKIDYEAWYKICFLSNRKQTLTQAMESARKKILNRSVSDPPVILNPALPDDAKKQQLIANLSIQFEQEKNFLLKETQKLKSCLDSYVKEHQRKELIRLDEICELEKKEVMRKMELIKQENLKKIPPTVSKGEEETRKKRIMEKYKDQCVNERRNLHMLQEKRKTEVEENQKAIFQSLEEDFAKAESEVHQKIEKKIADVETIYEKKERDIHMRRGVNNTSSFSATDGESDTTYL